MNSFRFYSSQNQETTEGGGETTEGITYTIPCKISSFWTESIQANRVCFYVLHNDIKDIPPLSSYKDGTAIPITIEGVKNDEWIELNTPTVCVLRGHPDVTITLPAVGLAYRGGTDIVVGNQLGASTEGYITVTCKSE